jgi:hypothetical protein
VLRSTTLFEVVACLHCFLQEVHATVARIWMLVVFAVWTGFAAALDATPARKQKNRSGARERRLPPFSQFAAIG